MAIIKRSLAALWRLMLTAPWAEKDSRLKVSHWGFWIFGWMWALAGMVAGAFVAPALLRFVGLGNNRYQDVIAIGITVAAGYLMQLVFSLLFIVIGVIPFTWLTAWHSPKWLQVTVQSIVGSVLVLAYFAVVLADIPTSLLSAADQRLVSTAFVGGFLVKAFLIPFIKSIITGSLLLWIKRALGIGQPARPSEP